MYVLVNMYGDRIDEDTSYETLQDAEAAVKAEWVKGWEVFTAVVESDLLS